MPESTDPPFDWLDPSKVLAWLNSPTGDNATKAESARVAAGDWVEHQRRDLLTEDGSVFLATPRVVQAGILATARLYERAGSPAGLVSFQDFGVGAVLYADPDVTQLLGLGRHGKPSVG